MATGSSRKMFDLDGHHWEVVWMDPAVVAGEVQVVGKTDHGA